MDAILSICMDILRVLASIRTPFLNSVFGIITQFGEETVVILFLCALYWCFDKYLGYTTGIVFFSTSMVTQGLKIICRIPRPWVLDPSFEIVESARGAATGYSFPSGHTQGAAANYGSVGFWTKNKLVKTIFFLLAALVGFSRMYLGVHTPLDVVVSFIIVLPTAYIVTRLFKTKPNSTKRDVIATAVVTLMAVGICALAVTLSARGLVDWSTAVNYTKEAAAAIAFAFGGMLERKFVRFSTSTKNIGLQIVKLLLGIIGVLAIKEGLKLVIGSGIAVDALRYFLMVLWASLLYPMVIKKLFNRQKSA